MTELDKQKLLLQQMMMDKAKEQERAELEMHGI